MNEKELKQKDKILKWIMSIPFFSLAMQLVIPAFLAKFDYKNEECKVYKELYPKPKLTKEQRLRLSEKARLLKPKDRYVITIYDPDTVVGWVKYYERLKWTFQHKTKSSGRPRIPLELEKKIIKLAESMKIGYLRIVGELKKFGFTTNKETVQNVLKRNNILPAPYRKSWSNWMGFIKRVQHGLLACDLFTKEVLTLKGLVRYYTFVLIEVNTRRFYLGGTTINPTGEWLTQQARNYTQELNESGKTFTHLIRDRDPLYTVNFDKVFESENIKVKKIGPRKPFMNAYAERLIKTIRDECLFDMFFFGVEHYKNNLKDFQFYYNHYRPHQGIDNNVPVPLPDTYTKQTDKSVLKFKEFLGGQFKHFFWTKKKTA